MEGPLAVFRAQLSLVLNLNEDELEMAVSAALSFDVLLHWFVLMVWWGVPAQVSAEARDCALWQAGENVEEVWALVIVVHMVADY